MTALVRLRFAPSRARAVFRDLFCLLTCRANHRHTFKINRCTHPRSQEMGSAGFFVFNTSPSRKQNGGRMAATACLIMLAVTGLILIMLWEVLS